MSESVGEFLPPFFPLVRKGCEQASSELFQCLSEKSEPQGSSSAAKQALIDCKSLKDVYSKCIEKSLTAKGANKPIVLTEWETD